LIRQFANPCEEDRMRPSLISLLGGALAMTAAGCASALHVDTLAAPNAGIASFTTFRVLRVPPPRDGRPRTDTYDPMVNNSIANRALRESVTQGLTASGYTVNERAPDFDVAVYATAVEKLDVTQWDYGYAFWPSSRWNWDNRRVVLEPTEYKEGTVIVDIVRPNDRQLLWRGAASARMWGDAPADVKELQKVAAGIVKKFPRAVQQRVALAR
jgi:hypothetical protein